MKNAKMKAGGVSFNDQFAALKLPDGVTRGQVTLLRAAGTDTPEP